MPSMVNIQMQNGEIVFRPACLPTTATAETAASDGRLAYLEVSFPITSTFEDAGVTISNSWTFRMVSPGFDLKVPFHEIEAAAARRIGPMLRLVAEQIEQVVDEFDADEAAAAPI